MSTGKNPRTSDQGVVNLADQLNKRHWNKKFFQYMRNHDERSKSDAYRTVRLEHFAGEFITSNNVDAAPEEAVKLYLSAIGMAERGMG